MENNHNEDSNLAPHKINLNDFESQEMKIVIVLLKHLIDSKPNDADLGKEMRILFDKITA
jgi:hypothetical protein